MFSYSKNDTFSLKPTTPIELAGTMVENDQIQLSWNVIRNPDERENKIWYYKIYNKDSLIGTTEYDNLIYEFSVFNDVNTFRVSAVDYHFKESSKSDIVSYHYGSIVTEMGNFLPAQRLNYILYQNYTNPFNPKTKISFSISIQSHVTLKIYDLFGKVIIVLVNEEKSPGNYSIDVDFSNILKRPYSLSSGIYFYQLKINEIIKT